MILKFALRSAARAKARFLCAALGIAAATAAVVFMASLDATNSAQAPLLAARAAAPWSAWRISSPSANNPAPGLSPDLALPTLNLTIDYRPGGKVLQGPPMRATLAPAPPSPPYPSAPLVEGRWPNPSSPTPEIACTRSTFLRFGRGTPPPLGSTVKFVGSRGALSAKITGWLAPAKLPPAWPAAFANPAAFSALASEPQGSVSFWRTPPRPAPRDLLTPQSPSVANAFTGDENRQMSYVRPLLLAAAVLTALSLLVNSLILSVESNRKQLAALRILGATRRHVVAAVAAESLAASILGLAAGSALAILGVSIYAAAHPATFPAGPAFSWLSVAACAAAAPAVAAAAILFTLRGALQVRPLQALSREIAPRRIGMAVAFACGFAAFVAVEVWGASLMRGFIPSPQWPDAIVSILPAGVSSFDIEKLRRLPGVARISELSPLQVNFHPLAPMQTPPRSPNPSAPRRPAFRNALLLASEWLPPFRFTEGSPSSAASALDSGSCIISEMISRSRNLHPGDHLELSVPNPPPAPPSVVRLPIAGVVDVNWHMVTSRGLVRGLNRAPVMTDGPVFVSFDTLESIDPRPAPSVKMTHLCLDYQPEFLARHGVFPAGRLVEKSIAAALGNPASSTIRLHARDEIADGTLAHGSSLIGQIARVPFIFLAILSLGFIAMLVAHAEASRREYRTLRAIGATRHSIALKLAAQALKTAALGIPPGAVLGALAGWLFAGKTASVWPGMPRYFEIPWQILLEGTLASLTCVLLISLPASLSIISHKKN